jgi:hypothetical protein
VLGRAVVENKIHNDADVALLGAGREMLEVFERAVHGVDIFVVRDVIAEIDLRGGIARRNPNGIDSKCLQVVEPGGDAVKIPDAVAIAVSETARVDLIEDGVLPPGMRRPFCGRSFGRGERGQPAGTGQQPS